MTEAYTIQLLLDGDKEHPQQSHTVCGFSSEHPDLCGTIFCSEDSLESSVVRRVDGKVRLTYLALQSLTNFLSFHSIQGGTFGLRNVCMGSREEVGGSIVIKAVK